MSIDVEFDVIVKDCTWLLVSWLAIQATADIVIATRMYLLLRRRRTGVQKTDSVINRMVLYTISTGLVTSVLSCIDLMLFAKYGFQFGVFATGMALGPFYSITMLANLHMRKILRARLATPSPLALNGIKKSIWKNAGGHGREETFQTTRIYVTTEVVCDDVDITPVNSDTNARFPVVQGPVLGAGGEGAELEPKVSV
ncbi:hypothetical protein BS47DRAFT_1342763 [Hydnum rufescens UP504]|uniref:DUF6534 domain-containing protein n=1 Tax=Hydnum rufescens UP504 TaxID=1448309 RepID=A0A9P6B1U1_9AGAM|nr:hypothetical protein BS47DRAFT_1342763 [Hydnum rufescens UP504]